MKRLSSPVRLNVNIQCSDYIDFNKHMLENKKRLDRLKRGIQKIKEKEE